MWRSTASCASPSASYGPRWVTATASPDFFDTLNPTFSGHAIYWMLSREGEHNVSEIHRYNRAKNQDERVATQIPGVVRGFAYDAGRAYYSLGTEIHEVTGLTFEKAPRIKMYG